MAKLKLSVDIFLDSTFGKLAEEVYLLLVVRLEELLKNF